MCLLSLKKIFPEADKFVEPLYNSVKKNFESMNSNTYPLLYGMHASIISKTEGPSVYVKTVVRSRISGEIGFESRFKIKNHPASIHSRKNNELVNEIKKLKKKYSHISKNSSNFKNYSIFLGASGAIIEALERGCKVIQITEIPILDFYSKYFWNSIKSKKINENIFTYSLIKKGNLINLGKKPKNLDLFFNKRTN